MSDRRIQALIGIAVLVFLSSTASLVRAQAIEPSARKGIDVGNQVWIDGMKRGEAEPIAATYVENAVDCGPAGDCVGGRAAIENHIKELLASRGHAQSAQVTSMGSVQQGSFVYEWGRAEATFAKGDKLVDRYLTVWRQEEDGSWKIFRNMVIPDGDKK